MAFKDREEFLDALFDHIFPEADYPDGPDDEDEKFFEHVSKFFPDSEPQGGSSDQSSGGTNPPRRRRSSGQSSAPRRRRRQAASSGASGYGNAAFFGTSK